VLSVEPIAIMLRKDDPAFKKAVDDSIKRHDEVGSRSPSSTTSGSCSPSRRPTPRSACRSRGHQGAWANPNDKPMEDYAKK
jgi:glutamate/aspartate transport system substrate-binding protein